MLEAVGSSEKTHWANLKEAGSVLGIRFLFGVHKLFGRWIFTVALFPAVAYYLVRKPVARRASLEYLRQLHSFAPGTFQNEPGIKTCAKHVMSFCQATLDKLLAWCEPIDEADFDMVDQDQFDHILSDSRGQVIIGSHFGNLEYCRGFTSQSGKRVINALVHDKHAENFAHIMAQINPDSRLNLYQVTELDIPTIAELRERLERGEWVFIAGDRAPVNPNERTLNAEFLGRPAPLPIGPFILAASLQHPVNFLFAYRSDKGVSVRFKRIAESIELSRKNRQAQLQALIQEFADELSNHCKIEPLQWFNFYPFWDQSRYQDADGLQQTSLQETK